MISKAIREYLSYKWGYENVAFKRVPLGTDVTETQDGLWAQTTYRDASLTGEPGDLVRIPYGTKQRYVLELSAAEWQALQQYVQKREQLNYEEAEGGPAARFCEEGGFTAARVSGQTL